MRLRDPQRFPPVVCCNLSPPSGFGGRWETGLLFPVRGLRVGVVGFIGAQAYEAIPPEERAGFAFQEVSAELLSVERDRLLPEGADAVIGVSHSGFGHDVALQESGLSPFDLIVAAHCHREQYHWTSGTRHVVKAPELGAGLLRLDLDSAGAWNFTTEYHPPTTSAVGPGRISCPRTRHGGPSSSAVSPLRFRTGPSSRNCWRPRPARTAAQAPSC